MGRKRNPRSSRQAGTRLEREVADYLAEAVDDRIDRKAKTGALDKGDVGGVRHHGHRVVIECKDVATTSLAGWIKEAHTEAKNDNAAVGVIVHKRRGRGDPADQWVTMTLSDLAFLLTGTPQDGRYDP